MLATDDGGETWTAVGQGPPASLEAPVSVPALARPDLAKGSLAAGNWHGVFNVWTREAGAGGLSISVEGPSKALLDFKDRKDGSCYVSYTVSEPGKLESSHDNIIPYHVYVMPQVGDTSKISLGFVQENLEVKKPVNFTIMMNGAKGNLDGKVIAPSGVEDDCFLVKLDEDQWALRFVPVENGVHQIHIRCNGIHIPDSPFRVRVGHDVADPAAVQAYGPGLKFCTTGTKMEFYVDTCNAGVGTMAVSIDGPSKVSMDCSEVDEGYKVRYTPLTPGDYLITVKYNGYHISGSPFKVNCTGSPVAEAGLAETSSVVVDTVAKQGKTRGEAMPQFRSDVTKVTSKGMGLKKATLEKQNMFTVNCGNAVKEELAVCAGNNVLYAAVLGPRGPSDEVYVKHMGSNVYQVTYRVKEKGDHIVIVKWGEDHIPGSPFKVEVS
ncbi:cher [Cordylochernes scorpioides]|uniref:Cher n=1 Tax=Cordylochernes scorpioides TaxID=51811 RepID=A0ABY6KYM3_9ARAC|nr:cher [Cordylochernes scorpioides]